MSEAHQQLKDNNRFLRQTKFTNEQIISELQETNQKLVEALRDAQLAFMNLRTGATQDASYLANPDGYGSAQSIMNWPWLDGWFERARTALAAAQSTGELPNGNL